MLSKLIQALKNRGIPIEEIYDQDIRKKTTPSYSGETSQQTEDEFVQSAPQKGRPPVPRLDLTRVKPEEDSAEEDSSYSNNPINVVQ